MFLAISIVADSRTAVMEQFEQLSVTTKYQYFELNVEYNPGRDRMANLQELRSLLRKMVNLLELTEF